MFGLLVGCGSEDTLEQAAGPIFPAETLCLSCDAEIGSEEESEYVPTPRVRISPEELMFYPNSLESAEFEPKEVIVTNATGHLVFVTRAYVTNSTKAASPNGYKYFATDPIEESIPLEDGEGISLWVRYLGSERQQSASLVVHTTWPDSYMLSVHLVGKYFIDG